MMNRYSIAAIVPFLVASLITATGSEQVNGPKTKPPVISAEQVPWTQDAISASAEIPAGWNRYLLEDCGLSIALPGQPITSKMVLPDTLTKAGLSGRQHSYAGNGYGVAVSHMLTPKQFEIRLFTKSFVEGIGTAPNVSNLKYTIDPGSSPNNLHFAGGVDLATVHLEFAGFAEVRGKNAWCGLVTYQPVNKAAGDEGKKALASARFDGPECPDQ